MPTIDPAPRPSRVFRARVTSVCLLALASVLVPSTVAWAQISRLLAPGGVEPNGPTFAQAITPDGRFVLFTSLATNWVPGDILMCGIRTCIDAFLYDRQSGSVEMVGVSSSGAQPTFDIDAAAVSADGRYVAFSTAANNLVPGLPSPMSHIYVRDRILETTSLVSINSGGVPGNEFSVQPDISADGRLVVFASAATNLVPGDAACSDVLPIAECVDIFVHDRQTGTTARVNVSSNGEPANLASYAPSISGNGHFVAFSSIANNLVEGDSNNYQDAFVYDRQTGETTRVSVSTRGGEGNGYSFMGAAKALSVEGRYVAFNSVGTNLVPGDTTAQSQDTAGDLFLHDRQTKETVRITTNTRGQEADGRSRNPVFSPDGRFVGFYTAASNLVAGDTNGFDDAVLYDRVTRVTIRLSQSALGAPANSFSDEPALSDGARVIAFTSWATNLVSGVPTGAQVYVVNLDPDADALLTPWEEAMGLNPNSAAGPDGAAGDPDGDGRTNAQEYAAGTHPRGVETRYLAEGATGTFFDTRIALFNPSTTSDTTAVVRFSKATGAEASVLVTVPRSTRVTVLPQTAAALDAEEFSTRVESDAPLVVDRTMRWDASGYGAHAETSVLPSTTWYFAEGATHSGFDLFYLIQNVTATPANVTVTYLRPAPAGPLVKTYVVGANRRFNIWVADEAARDPALAGLSAADISAVITADQPVLVERAMYLSAAGVTFAAGHVSAGATAPSTRWLLAEGATGPYFDLFVLIGNPGASSANVRASYLLPNGDTLTKNYVVEPRSRFNIWVDLEHALLTDTALSVSLESTNGVPIVVERSMWWPGPTSSTWQESHNVVAASSTALRWAFADGEVGGTSETATYVLIANTSTVAGAAAVTLAFEDGTTTTKTFVLPASSRTNVDVGAEFPAANGRRFGARIESVGATPAQLVVERAMYWTAGSQRWAAGTALLGTPLP